MNINTLNKMAWRNLWRNRRRTIITLSSIAFCTMLTVLFTGIQDATWMDIINTAAKLSGGHVTLQHPEYQEKPALSRTIHANDIMSKTLQNEPHVSQVMPRISGQTMLATAQDNFGASFLAYDPRLENKKTLSILDSLVEGQPFQSSHDRTIVLGSRLAKNLGVSLGKKVVYTMTGKNGEIVTGLARVAGILQTGSPSIDLGLCLLPIDTLREALGYQPDEATLLAVFLDDHRHSDQVVQSLQPKIGAQITILTWEKAQPDLASFIALKKGGMVFFELLILVLCAAGIFNTLFVSVMERIREFGVMLAIGCSPAHLFFLVVFESIWLALVGLFSAVFITTPIYLYLSRVGIDMSQMMGETKVDIAGVGMSMILHVGIYVNHAIAIACVVVLTTMLASLYPAWKAGLVSPVETIKIV